MTTRPPLVVFDGQSLNMTRRERWLLDLMRRYPQVFDTPDENERP